MARSTARSCRDTCCCPVSAPLLLFSPSPLLPFSMSLVWFSFVTSQIYPMVETSSLSVNYSAAVLNVMFELANYGNAAINGNVTLRIPGIGSCELPLTAAPGLTQVIVANTQCAVLKVMNPRLWWPAQMGTPCIHLILCYFSHQHFFVTSFYF